VIGGEKKGKRQKAKGKNQKAKMPTSFRLISSHSWFWFFTFAF